MSVDETKMEPLPTAVAEPPPSQAVASTTQSSPPPPPVTASQPVGVRIRPKICDVRNCDSNSLRNPEILFVGVPGHSYPERRFVWLTLMQAARDKKRSYCCSRHFKVPDDFKDFQEFISAPPGYKRQLLVKKGVVPHLNMPPLNMSALPPLTDRWPMTLPRGMTETDQLQQNAARASIPPPMGTHCYPLSQHRGNNQQVTYSTNRSRVKYCKAVQTEPPAATKGPRKVPPSLQYCRLCFKRQDLEPIFTGDQTLIEPDLIDKIFGCTEVRISVESDFPSSICTGCYTSVQEFVKFRKLVQLNDQSLRGIPIPSMSSTLTRSPSIGTPTTSVRTKTTETIPMRPAMKVTPVRQVSSGSPARRREDPLLEVQRVENVERYQRRQQTIERNQPLRAQRVQDTLFPVPYRRPVAETTISSGDPLANVGYENELLPKSEDSSTPEGVQLNDRIVPVTLIRVQSSENAQSNEDVELQVPNTVKTANSDEGKPEDVTVKQEEEQRPETNIMAKPLNQLIANQESRKLNPPSVLQAVKLLPSATAKALANQKSSLKPISTLTRGITSGRFQYRAWKPSLDKYIPKQPISRMLPNSLVRGIRFPGTMTTLFSGSRKPHKPHTSSGSPKPPENPKPAVTSLNADQHKPPVAKPQVLQEMKLPVKSTTAPSPISKPKIITPAEHKPKQKENSVPASPENLTPNIPTVPPANLSEKPSVPQPVSKPPPKSKQLETSPAQPVSSFNSPPPSPRSSRIRKVPLKFKDSANFPMPKIITIKSDPDGPKVESSKVPQDKSKEVPIRTTRRSNVAEEKPAESQPPNKPDRKQTDQKNKQPKEDEPPKTEPPVVRLTRRSDTANKTSETQQMAKPIKRKSDTKPDPIANDAPSASKSSKVEPKRNSLDSSKTKNTPALSKTTKVEPKRNSLSGSKAKKPVAKVVPPPSKSPKVDPKRNSLEKTKMKQQQAKQKPKLEQRANGSRKGEQTAEVRPKKAKEAEPSIAPPVSSQDWKCPFCPNKVFDQKKGLVKHLRKRHGMDYALVRQRLAIYGGNWR